MQMDGGSRICAPDVLFNSAFDSEGTFGTQPFKRVIRWNFDGFRLKE